MLTPNVSGTLAPAVAEKPSRTQRLTVAPLAMLTALVKVQLMLGVAPAPLKISVSAAS